MTTYPTPVPRRILIIGAGPTGLVTLRNLIERGNFEHVKLYERRDDVGGVWYLDQEDPLVNGPRWPSPAYKGLVGNVLPEFLSFSEFPFPEPPSSPHQRFPTLTETHQYLQRFAAPYLENGAIKLNREVIQVTELVSEEGWSVVSRDWSAEGRGVEVQEVWDAVVVCVGWYDTPVWPDTPGLDELRAKGLAKHAKWWRGPSEYEGMKVLIIGNANSSNDMAAQLAPLAALPVYQSIRRPSLQPFVNLEDERIEKVAPVEKYVLKITPEGTHKVDAFLTDNTLVADLDIVQIGTGYRPMPQFLRVLGRTPEDEGKLVPLVREYTKPPRIPSLHRHIIYAHNPTLAFIGSTLAYTPFTIADLASTWLSLAWSDEITYPDTSHGRLNFERERLHYVESWRQSLGSPSSLMVYSVLGPSEQEYAATLRNDVVQARPQLNSILPIWSDERTLLREAMYKKKYESLIFARRLTQTPIIS